MKPESRKSGASGKLSLFPLSLEEALRAALQVEPPAKEHRKGRVKKEKPPEK